MIRAVVVVVTTLALAVALAAAQSSGSTTGADDAWKTVRIPSLSTSAAIPATWRLHRQQGTALLAYDPASNPVIGTTVSVKIVPARTFDDVSRAAVTRCRTDVRTTDPAGTFSLGLLHLRAGRVRVCSGHVHLTYRGTTYGGFLRVYGVLHGTTGVLVYGQALGQLAARQTPVFDRIVESLQA